MFRITYGLPPDIEMGKICAVVEGMFPSPVGDCGVPKYVVEKGSYRKDEIRMMERDLITGEEVGIDQQACHYSFPVDKEYPIVDVSEETDPESDEDYISIEISLADPSFTDYDGSTYDRTGDDLTPHQVDRLQHAAMSYRFVAELMRRLVEVSGESSLESISASFDMSATRNLLHDFVQVEKADGWPTELRARKASIPYEMVVGLIEMFGSELLPPATLGLIFQASEYDADLLAGFVEMFRDFLRGQISRPIQSPKRTDWSETLALFVREDAK